MNTLDTKTVIGIDVAKDTLSVSIFDGKVHIVKEINYTIKNINNFIKKFNKEKTIFVMEATGVYHLKVATTIFNKEFKVFVINPFVIKKYSQMKLMRIKTDNVDAKLIASFGYEYYKELKEFKPSDIKRVEVDNTIKAIDDLNHLKTITNNQLQAIKKVPNANKGVIKSYQNTIKYLTKEIAKLKKELEALLKENFSKEFKLLNSIPGVGLKVIAMIIAFYDSFKSFDSAKKVVSFAGIAPSPYESGTSIKRRGGISKKGNSLIRKIIYMATLSATLFNPLVKQKYQRLIQRGKSKMTALIAAANKLLRITFGVLKSQKPFDVNYLANIS
jgi:transposase